jgi:predicted NBD/HSP70 family sugar kinase
LFYFGVQKNVAAFSHLSQHAKQQETKLQRKIKCCDCEREAMREKADSELVRRQNRRLVLDALRYRGPMARIDVGRRTGLSPASITSITSQLIADGILLELSDPSLPVIPLRRGRPVTLLGVNPKVAYVVAVKISISGIELVLADGSGAIQSRHTSRIATYDAEASTFGTMVANEIATFLARSRIAPRRVARIGIAVQGVADSQKGTVMWSPAFRVRNISVAPQIQQALGIPCSISNDANMIAEGLIGMDRQRYGGTTAIVFLGYGVGMGLVINGQVYHGPTGAAAEFGHMNHLPDGLLCRCGRHGCVEAYAADYGILRLASASPANIEPTFTAVPEEDMLALEQRARSGDTVARDAYAGAGRALGYGLARLIALLNPGRIVLAGPGTRAMDLIDPHLKAAIAAGVVDELRRNVEIETVPIDTDMIIKGTIDGALRRLDMDVFAIGPVAKRQAVLEESA